MEYTKEGFIKLYDEYRQAFHNHADALTYEDRLKASELKTQKYHELGSYGESLLKQNPNNKEIACIVYSGLPLKSGAYSSLSDELKNDKLVTLLALNNFDETSYNSIGENLKGDKEVMFALANNTAGVLSASQLSENLVKDEKFWVELLTYAYIRENDTLDVVISQLHELDNSHNLNLDFNVINAAAMEVKANGHERGDNQDRAKLSTSALTTRASFSPHFMENLFQGNVEEVEKCRDCSAGLHEFLVSEAQKARASKMTSTNTHTESVPLQKEEPAEETHTETPEKTEDVEQVKKVVEALSALRNVSPDLLSAEQQAILEKSEKYLAMLNGGMSEEATIESRKVR